MAYKGKVIHNPVTGQSIRFLQTSADTAGALLEMESSYAPRSIEPPLHYHPAQQEIFTVVKGCIRVHMNGDVKEWNKGEQVTIPPNTVHSMWNAAETSAVVNWKVMPALSTERFLETGMGLAATGKVNKKGLPSILQTALLVRSYKNVFRLAKPPYFLQRILFDVLTPFAKLAGYKAFYNEYID